MGRGQLHHLRRPHEELRRGLTAMGVAMSPALPHHPLWLVKLASPALTVVFFLTTAAAALSVKEGLLGPTQALVLPFSLLLLNLAASILTHPRFRSSLPLLVLHLALLMIVALFVTGRLTYMYGAISLTKGTQFDGIVDKIDQGPYHPVGYDKLKIVHAHTTERFNDDIGHHIDIRNTLRWQNHDKRWHETELAFGYPIIIDGYRIYPSGRRGYVAIFEWAAPQGMRDMGAVQLFGSGIEVMENTNRWVLPNGQEAWLLLEKDDPAPPPRGTVRTDMGARDLPHKLVLRVGDERHEIRLGDEISLQGGKLRYLKLESWGGYELIYDPTEPWLIASIILAICALAWYYYSKFARPAAARQSP